MQSRIPRIVSILTVLVLAVAACSGGNPTALSTRIQDGPGGFGRSRIGTAHALVPLTPARPSSTM